MKITLEVFKALMIAEVNKLIAVNAKKDEPWTKRDFLKYIRGACDWFFLEHDIEYDRFPSVIADIYVDSHCFEEFEEFEEED